MTSLPISSGLRLTAMTLAIALLLPGCGDAEKNTQTTSTGQPAGGSTAAVAPAATGDTAPTPSGPSSPAASDSEASLEGIIYQSGSIPIRPGATAVYGDPADVDFGVVTPGSKLRTEIRLVNPTDQPVVLRAAVPTCQCTTVNVDGTIIPSMGAVGIPMTLQVPSTTGEKKAAVNTVLVPGGKGPRLTLRAIAAYAVRATASTSAGGPSTLWVDALKPAGISGRIQLDSTDGRPFRVLSVNGETPMFLQGTGQPATTQSIAYDLSGRTSATMPKWMLIETDHPDAPMVEMRVRHMASRLPHQFQNYKVKVQFDGYIANVGRISPGSTAEFSVELKQFKRRTLSGLRSGNPDFVVNLLQRKDGDGDRVRITGSITPKPGFNGPFICPVQFNTPEGAETMYVIGTIR
ncbi:MAG: hypothetical protein CMJ34_14190 [Phycisphaerae bacterium]|nr:hypothetical protein [Phycisphaerae bacterium]